MGVLIEHFVPSGFLRSLSPGGAGVTLFFVLSGFLITRILISYRGVSIRIAARQFYWRRFLRLSPPLYLAITFAVLFGFGSIRRYWWVHALYLTNFQIAMAGQWLGSGDHFWSLCTEEQFYLLWVFIVLLTSQESLFIYILISFFVTLIFRSYVYFSNDSSLITVLLPGNLASMAAGALLITAFMSESYKWIWMAAASKRWLIATATVFLLVSFSIRFMEMPRAIFYPFIASAFSACLVAAAANGNADPWLDWLSWKPVRYVGRISYGIYVYHMFLPPLVSTIPSLQWVGNGGLIGSVALIGLSVGIAHLSWIFIESPILRYKNRFPLARSASAAMLNPANPS